MHSNVFQEEKSGCNLTLVESVYYFIFLRFTDMNHILRLNGYG